MKLKLTLLFSLLSFALFSQVITPFSIRYQATQKGGIRYISNTSVTCSGPGCGAGRTEVPPAGTGTDNGFTAAYVDIDSDGSTFSSSSDSIALPLCSQISWAGLYWGAEMDNTGANYATRNQVKIKLNNGAYVSLTADQLQDNAVGFSTYHCFKDITTLVQSGGTNARYTVANVACRVGASNRFGGWTIVVVYRNDLQPMRNLTVFNGLSNVSGANPITDITVSGFLTPLSGPVTFEVGHVTHDGDRSSTGDQLMFNGGSGFVNISDAVNPLNDIFNSTLSYNGVQKTAPFINPGYTNTLGFDADIYIPNNAAKNYIGNSATSATLRLTTGGETFLTQVVTMAIDVYEPDLRAGCRVVDLNGGSVLPGDILEYTVTGKNIGSDPSVNTYMIDTLEYNAVYVPGSIVITNGPNAGAKSDASGDDQAEYIAASRRIVVRAGTGANAVTGGQMNNSALGVDSTVFRFRAMATTDCIVLNCDNIINNRAYIYGTGNVSGNTWSNGSNPNIFDINGCPVPGTTNTPISAASCPAPSVGSNSPVCTGNTINLTSSPTSTTSGVTYSWTGPGGFVSSAANPTRANATVAMAGTYTCVITVPGSTACSYTLTTVVAINTTPATPAPSSNTPVCTGNTINLFTAAVAGATYSWTGPSSFASALQNPTRPGATAAMAGTYSVTVTANGCTSGVGTTVVVVNTTPSTPTPSSNTPVCTGNTINLFTPAVGGATYSWTGPSSFASSVQNPTRTNATVAMAGTYSVTTTVSGCTSPVGTTVVVVNTTPATPTASSNTPVCTGNTISLTTPNVAGATYSWTGPNSFASSVQNPTITNATTAMAGTYSVTVTTNGCTSAVGTTAVVVNSTPATPTASSNTPVCTGNTISLTTPNVAGATYSWTGPNSFVSSVQNPTITNATTAMAGTYSVTVTTNGCTSGVGTTAVVVNATPATPTASSNTPVCTGNTISLTTPNVAGATYSWTGPSSFASSVQNPTRTNATVAMAGTYSVTVTVNGCTSGIGTTAVVVNTTPATPTASSNTPVCSGNTISLTTPNVAGATYSWTGPNSFASSVQNPTITNATVAMGGTYSVTVTTNGCTSAVGTTAVVVNATPATPAPGSNSPVCTGNTINLTTSAVAGATYSWTGPNSFVSSVQNPSITNATAAMAGTYSLTVTTNGCTSAIGTTAVVVNTTPSTPTAGSNSPICAGNTLNLTTPNVVGATYSWTGPNSFSSSAQNPSITNATTAASGTYSVTVTVNGCTSAAGTTAVTVNPGPATPSASSNSPVCSGNTINLTTPNVAGATYTWTGPNSFSSNVQNPTITNATTAMSGTYSVTITISGCTSNAGTVAVVVNATPATPAPGSNSPVCTGNTINLTTATVAGATYAWTGPNSFVSSVQNPSITNATAAMAGTYSLTVTTNGCTSAVGTVNVVINTTPSAPTAGSNSPVCTGNAINLTSTSTTGTYSWTGPNSFTSSAQNPTVASATLADAGTYSVTITENGCTSAAGTVAVVVNATPATPAPGSNSPVCTGDPVNLSGPATSGTYTWTGPNSFTSSVQNPVITPATLADAGTYSLVITENGCSSAAGTTNVVINATPSAPTAGSNSPVCESSAINLTSTSTTGTYSWSGPNGFSATTQNPTIASATLADAGTYTVTITENGCTSAPGTVAVVVNATPATPTAGSNSPVCEGDAINLTSSATTGTYTWTGPNSFTSSVQNPVITPSTLADAGTYSLTVTENGCVSAEVTTSVTVNPIPAAPTAGSNSPVCEGDAINLTSTATSGTYTWTGPNSFSSSLQNPSIAVSTSADAGTYSITITELGCTSAAGTVVIVVNPIPTAPTAGSNSPVCEGSAINLTSTATSGTYTWTGPNSFTSSVQNPTIAPATLADAGTYSVTVTELGCTSAAGTVAVTVNPTPAAPNASAGSDTLCATQAITLFADTIPGATYQWNGPNGFSSTDQNPVIPNSTVMMSGAYTVVVIINGCVSPADTVNVVVISCGDNDNDGIIDIVDLDDDNDGVTDITEGTNDTDGDGIADCFDLDSDNDGITDVAENNGVDTDGDGIIDGFTDVDGNGLADIVDPAQGGTPMAALDNDGDGTPNYLDLDSDNDGIVDVVETGGVDANNDGQVDATADANNNGLDDSVDPATGGTPQITTGADTNSDGLADSWPADNTDSNGGPNFLDIDSDNDGIVDNIEAQSSAGYVAPSGNDTDGDGIDDAYDAFNGFGGAGVTPVNTDGTADGADYIDLDADNDSMVDALEGWDTNNDGIADTTPSGNDADNDGLDDAYDANTSVWDPTNGQTPTSFPNLDNTATSELDWRESDDNDGDGIVDSSDPDDDNDGILDINEGPGDTDGDGIVDAFDLDSDNDGIPDVVESGGSDPDGDGIIGSGPIADTDGDGLADAVDADNGGTPLIVVDTDGDGTPNYMDLDSDNDGITDVVEAGGADANNDGMLDNYVDTDGDGFNDAADTDAGGTSLPNTDSDNDGLSNMLDLDADNDGIVDNIEAQTTTGYIVPSGNDTDGDGIDDAYDAFNGFGGAGLTPVNTDGADQPDYLDLDTDNDGISDLVEGNDFNNDNQPDVAPSGNDSDNDGLDDSYDNVSTSGTSNVTNNDNPPSGTTFPDVDEAGGELDWRDPLDTDGDGIANNNDLDDDNDGIPDTLEANGDTDGDGIPDSLDLDSDNDGIVDIIEAGGTDTNGDGLVDNFVDNNNDGLDDNIAANPLPTPDTDNDGNVDFLDIDADNDGIVDNVEAQSTAGYVPPTGNDTDGDGIDNAYDSDNGGTPIVVVNTDGADTPDYLDLDSDNDGMSDLLEGWDTNNDGTPDTVPSGNDSDNDGLDDAFDVDGTSTANNGGATNNGTVPTGFPDLDNVGGDRDWRDPIDHDGDGIADINDLDDDNDGILDTVETTADNDGDGIPNSLDLDSDNDGIPDIIEVGGPDANGDGIVDNFVDNNNDGLDDNIAANPLPNLDSDGDGVPNALDLDSDNDGILDVTEAGGTDANGDGLIDGFVDTDNDGLSDNVDSNNGGTPLPNADTDADGHVNYLDIDSDNDGIVDIVEGQPTGGYIPPTGNDTDGDGIDDAYDISNGGTPINPVNTDGSDNPDYLDLDSDNDGDPDAVEAWDTNNDGDPEIIPSGNDSDGDGLDDAYDTDGTSTANNGGSTNGGTTPGSFPDLDTPGGDRDWREVLNPTVFVPTGFSPNNDNVNDFFEIVGIGAFPDNSVTIFNRWGNLVFEGTGYNNTTIMWDGQNTGALPNGNGPVPEGTYFYVIDLGDGSPVLSGYVFLNRK